MFRILSIVTIVALAIFANAGKVCRAEELSERSELSTEMVKLRQNLRDCLDAYYGRPENVQSRNPWEVMHALIAYGVDTEVLVGNQRANAIGWLCYNGACKGQTLFDVSQGKLVPRKGVGVQGHHGQFLAMLAQSKVPADFPIVVGAQEFTIKDLIRFEQLTCRPKSELTFKLIGLAHYLDSDAAWRDDQGQTWSISRLIQEELAQPIVGAACGGTHRLMGFAYAARKREREGKPLTGEFQRARIFLDDYHEYTFRLQNPDGSFSTKWFAGPAAAPDPGRRVQTSGHILEWLAYSLPQEQLGDERVIRAVDYLTRLLMNNPSGNYEIGPRGHALHALVIYDERLFGAMPGERTKHQSVAEAVDESLGLSEHFRLD
jgi:hypothetical protein